MQTEFSKDQLNDPAIRLANDILRTCVHCGFCTATCPTYVLLGDENDSPRGRVYLIKDMLEHDRKPSANVVKHIDRCLYCLSCETTCPSGVDYHRLLDHARVRIEKTYTRPLPERIMRRVLASVIPNPALFRLSLIGARLARPFSGLLPGRMKAMVQTAPASLPAPSPVDRPQIFPAEGKRVKRVALLGVCAQKVLKPGINEATIRLLTRHGIEVVIAEGGECCGALVHHMGLEDKARAQARPNIDAWWAETASGGGEGLDAIVVNASGCGTEVKDYGHLFKDDEAFRGKAALIGALAKDVTEVIADVGLMAPSHETGTKIAYHAACSLQHGQKIVDTPKDLLRAAGFHIQQIAEAHLCCGSAGVYSMLQPELSGRLRDRKVAALEQTQPVAIAAGNIGCITHIAAGTNLPVVHTVELLDWATGGPKPALL